MTRQSIGVDAAILAGLQVDMLQKLRSGSLTIEQLTWFLNLDYEHRKKLTKGRVVDVEINVGKYFMSVDVGQCSSIGTLFATIVASGKRIDKDVYYIFNRTVINVSGVYDLWDVTVEDLGFSTNTSRIEIYERALALGFHLCPPKALALASIYCKDEKWRLAGMKPIKSVEGDLRLLQLSYSGGVLHLITRPGRKEKLYEPSDIWVFALPRRSL